MKFALATEDELSEAIGKKLLDEAGIKPEYGVHLLRRQGNGYLRSRMKNWKQMAQHFHLLILTDLDQHNCPLALVENWLGEDFRCPDGMLLRIAVRQIESWALADHEAMRKLIGRRGRLPRAPDDLPDSKLSLLRLAASAPKAVREELLAKEGAVARQGLGYNRRMVSWVTEVWNPARAASRSESLARAREAIRKLQFS